MNEESAAIISTLQRHEASIQAMRTLAFALIATHHDHSALLEKFLTGMDAAADSLAPDSVPAYREEMQFFQTLMLDCVNRKTEADPEFGTGV